MTFKKLAVVLALAGGFAGGMLRATTTIISDTYNVTGNGSGYALNAGINTGINPPTTRLTGTAKANLRYIELDSRAASSYTISGNQLQVAASPNRGRMALSADGVNSFNFAPALGIGAASATNRVVYDLSVRLNNNSPTTQRYSIGVGTVVGQLDVWSFGFQIYRTNGGNSYYTVGKRIDTTSSGLADDINDHITSLTDNTYGDDITLLMRFTDAGSETTTYNSRVQLSFNGGNSWFYDTDTDTDLPNGFRFNGPERHILWDIAPDAGPVTYDAFSLKLDPPASNVNTSSNFRVIQYNIHFATQNGKVNTQRIANFILDQNADLVSLNEVDSNKSRSDNRYLIKELAQQTGMAYVFSNNTPALLGNGILSKFPVLYRDHRLLPNVGSNEQRGLIKSTVDVNGKFISFWSTHLDFHNSDTERLMCVTNFNTWIADETLPVILCGDFNDTPLGAAPSLMDQKWLDSWDLAGTGSGQTVPCPGIPAARIDYIWKAKTAGVTPNNTFVPLSMQASDHYPVISDFTVDNFTNHASGFYFPFDQGSGTTVIESLNGLKGTFTGGSSWNTNSPSGATNDFSLMFNGARRVTLVDTNQIIGTNGVNDNYTLQAWVKLAVNYAAASRVVLFQYDRKPGFSFSINPNRTLHTSTFKIKDISSTATIPNDGEWHHVAVVHTSGVNLKFYIDANLAATVAYTNGAGYRTDATITIGSAEDGTNPFTGYLDRTRFDERALAPAELDFPAIPLLGIRASGNVLTLFWPAAVTGYTLEANGTLQTNGWVTVPFQSQGTENQANIAPTNSTKFFRLKRE